MHRGQRIAPQAACAENSRRLELSVFNSKETVELANRLRLRFGRSNVDWARGGALDRGVNFRAMHRDMGRSLNSEANFVAAHVDNRHNDVVANHNLFITLASKDEHGKNLPW